MGNWNVHFYHYVDFAFPSNNCYLNEYSSLPIVGPKCPTFLNMPAH